MLSIYLLAWLGVMAAQISPGPNLAAVASVGLAQGRRPALCVVVGISSGMLVWSAATALGLGALIEAYPLSLLIMKFLGGGNAIFAPDARPLTNAIAWRRGILALLTNPKAALMWAAVASFLFGQGLSAWHVLAFGSMGALSGLIIYGTYACPFSTGIAVRSYSRFSRWFKGIFAATFGAMGISLIWAGVREARN